MGGDDSSFALSHASLHRVGMALLFSGALLLFLVALLDNQVAPDRAYSKR